MQLSKNAGISNFVKHKSEPKLSPGIQITRENFVFVISKVLQYIWKILDKKLDRNRNLTET